MTPELRGTDVIVIGGGAAGLATAILISRDAGPGVRCIDGARRIGAKILVSGGSRCNVTNRIVTERDFWGGSSRGVRDVLRAFPAARAREWFESLGVTLHEEEDGKLFPDSNRSRTVLDALLREAARVGVTIETGQRVSSISRTAEGFIVALDRRPATSASQSGQPSALPPQAYLAKRVVLATGGRSLPKSGSDGAGYALAEALGHRIVGTTPALAPLVFKGDAHAQLSGVAHPALLTLRIGGAVAVQLEGPMLWTHFGASGPVVLNMSRHWLRAALDGQRDAELWLNACPGQTFDSIERWWLEQVKTRPKAHVSTVVAALVPAALALAYLGAVGVAPDSTLAHVSRDERRRVVHHLTSLRLDVRDSRGYDFAEVTAGGVALDEIDPATMESRVCPGLYLVGEILDVDGRLGGFNFQWAWSSAWVASRSIARAISSAVTR